MLNTSKNSFYCHGCKNGGDTIELACWLLGCDFKEAVNALSRDFNINQTQAKQSTIYDYQDASGNLVYQIVREDKDGKKQTKQRRPDGKGGWVWNMKGIERLPYRLPELLRAISTSDTIYIAEGEKCVDALTGIGLTTTTNSGGAGKWTSTHSQHFPAETKVIILPDNDTPGRNHAQAVAKELFGRGCKVKIVDLPGLPDIKTKAGTGAENKADIFDWLAAGHTKDEFLIAADSSLYWEPDSITLEDVAANNKNNQFRLTDLGNAERLIYQNQEDIRFCPEIKLYLIWDGKRWRKDTDGEIMRRAIKTVRSMYDATGALNPEAQVKWAKASENSARLNAITSLARTLPGVPIPITELDKPKYFLNCLNGTINLKTGQLMPHDRKHNLTHLIMLNYRQYQDGFCPRWIKFLCDITKDNLELINYLWRLAGLCLSGDITEHILNIFWGAQGRNGKGVFLHTLQNILGDLSCVLPFSTFEVKNSNGVPNDIARMAGKRLIVAQESREGVRLDEAIVKTLTGGDILTGRFLHGEFFDFEPSHKIIMSSNHKPVIRETSEAMWTRLRLIPFEVSFYGRENKKLREELDTELEGILSWAVAGFQEWQRKGLIPPGSVEKASNEYRSEEDVIQSFIDEVCYVNENCNVSFKELHSAFLAWADKRGEKPITIRIFNNRIRQRGFEEFSAMGQQKLRGIGLASNQ